MIVYSQEKHEFIEDVRSNLIHEKILAALRGELGRGVSPSEIRAWRNSMQYMSNLLGDDEIPNDSRVSIEYGIPLTNKRVDFIISGQDPDRVDTAVMVELKQWSDVKATKKDAIVRTFVGGAERDVAHPSYQSWIYAALIEDYNETVREESVALKPCAYLHNLDSRSVIDAPFYREHVERAPVFISKDALKLAEFIKRYVRYGDASDIMYRIDNGKIKPSTGLVDALVSMLKGNEEFRMVDDQKVVYETALGAAGRARRAKAKRKVIIVEGGPGTGKSVVAVNLLVRLTERKLVAQYVSKNAAPRAVFAAKLSGTMTKTRINNLFKGSGAYVNAAPRSIDVLVVDEAHRLNEKSGLYGNQGDHQIKEIIAASNCAIFFLDEDQRVTWKDVGEKAVIRELAEQLGADVEEYALESQFRCNGSDGYLAWVDNALGIRETANTTLEGIKYDFRVFDDPKALHQAIRKKNKKRNRARLVAGYCWDWKSKRDPSALDIEIPAYNYSAQWNLTQDGSLWIMADESVEQVGCIHTCQGLEVDYIGVIIGPDFVVRDALPQTDGATRSRMDSSIKGYKKLLKENPALARQRADAIIKNTYRTLMTRGMKGCYIWCSDPETNEYFKAMLGSGTEGEASLVAESEEVATLPYSLEKESENSVPVFDLKAAAGAFSEEQAPEALGWWELPDHQAAQEGLFVAQVVGESMNLSIPNGSWCLFRANPGGTRNGKIVLAQHRDIADIDTGGHYTIKRYRSEKSVRGENKRVVLVPESNCSDYEALIFESRVTENLHIVAEFVSVVS